MCRCYCRPSICGYGCWNWLFVIFTWIVMLYGITQIVSSCMLLSMIDDSDPNGFTFLNVLLILFSLPDLFFPCSLWEEKYYRNGIKLAYYYEPNDMYEYEYNLLLADQDGASFFFLMITFPGFFCGLFNGIIYFQTTASGIKYFMESFLFLLCVSFFVILVVSSIILGCGSCCCFDDRSRQHCDRLDLLERQHITRLENMKITYADSSTQTIGNIDYDEYDEHEDYYADNNELKPVNICNNVEIICKKCYQNKKLFKLSCGHSSFCEECILHFIPPTCPTCKENIVSYSPIPV